MNWIQESGVSVFEGECRALWWRSKTYDARAERCFAKHVSTEQA